MYRGELKTELEPESEPEYTCVVCLDKVIKSNNNYCVSTCNHTFHLDCLLSVVKNKCPVCETLLKESDTINPSKNENEVEAVEQIDWFQEQVDLYEAPLDSIFIEKVSTQLAESELKNFLTQLKLLVELGTKIDEEIFKNFNDLCYNYDIEHGISIRLINALLRIKMLAYIKE